MKLELKSIKHSEFASNETHCYQGKVYVNGKPWAIVSNDGWGGCDMVLRDPRCDNERFNTITTEVNEYFESLPSETVSGEFSIQPNLEIWCADEVNNWLMKRELKKLLKKIVGKKNNNIYTFKLPVNESNCQRIEKDGYEVLNTMPFEKALKVFREHA